MVDVAATLTAALKGTYTVERELGRGGMAIVFLAQDEKHHRRVAIKVLKPEIATSIGAERFLREIRVAAQLNHPYILGLHDSGEADGLLYYVMPFAEGETLRQRIEREGQLPVRDALTITQQVAAALAHAHSLGIVHRDIKPENILLEGGLALVADFGIARAVSTAGGDKLTETGLTLGTLAYMSPEQAGGDHRLDGRSDLYSLACVLYEMLSGEPPFSGPTAQSIIAKHLQERPPSILVVRPRVPPAIDQALDQALAKVPADRHSGVMEFVEALTLKLREAAPVPIAGPTRTTRRWWLWAAPGVAIVALAMVFVPRLVSGSLNPTQYVLGTEDTGIGENSTEALRWELELQAALAQVPNVLLTEPYRANDRLLQLGHPPADAIGWFNFARKLGAGKLLLTRFIPGPDSTIVVVNSYDVARGRSIERAQVGVRTDFGQAAVRAVEQLFKLERGVIEAGATNDAARRAFVAGHQALKSWDLQGAERHFAEALAEDPADAQASLWLAKVKLWAGDPADEWLAPARRAGGALQKLRDDRERDAAQALRALGEGDYVDACRRFDAMVAADSQNFEAWFGLGECHARDRLVLPDRNSPSGFRFRSSRQAAITAYEHALEQVPSFAFQFGPLERLNTVLVVESGRVRSGILASPDSTLYAAWPSVDHDTLAYVPYPAQQIFSGDVPPPPNQDDAVSQNRDRLLRIVRTWAAAFPDSSSANQALARALELKGFLNGEQAPERSALAAARLAGRQARSANDSLESAELEVRLLLKLQRFDDLRTLASATLSRHRNPSPREARHLVGLAALTGRPNLTAALNATAATIMAEDPGGRYSQVALPVLEAWQRLMVYAAFGTPSDSIRAYVTRLDTLLQVHETPEAADRLQCDLVWYPRALAWPELRQVTSNERCWSQNSLFEMQWALNQGNHDAVRSAYDELRSMRETMGPGEVALQNVYHEALLLLGIGDTLSASQFVGRTLAAMGALRTSVVTEAPQAASLVRAMALRAELAAQARDSTVAREWARKVVQLWEDGEEAVRPVVDRMRQIAEG
ncbi:MAG TPA: protein kinase [Gemmatimonadales bacterium]|nr:protein kinase [Gemmatimonadales bacterium]